MGRDSFPALCITFLLTLVHLSDTIPKSNHIANSMKDRKMPKMKFQYAGVFKPNAKLVRSRQKFIENVERQIAAIEDPSYRYVAIDGVRRRPHSWVANDFGNDTAHIGLRYGARFMRRNNVPFGVVVPDPTPANLVAALMQVIADANKGKLDADLVEARTEYWS